jgi:hypothetical protein
MTTTTPTPKTLTCKTCSSNWCALKSVDILGQMQNNIRMLTSNAGGAHHVGGQLKYKFLWTILSKKTKPNIGNLDQHTNEPHLPPLNTCLMRSLLQVFNGGTGDSPFLLSPPSLFLHYKTMITVRLLCRKKTYQVHTISITSAHRCSAGYGPSGAFFRHQRSWCM